MAITLQYNFTLHVLGFRANDIKSVKAIPIFLQEKCSPENLVLGNMLAYVDI